MKALRSPRLWAPMVAIALLCAGVFGNTIGAKFVWDDQQFVTENLYLTSFRYLPRLFSENVVAGAGIQSNLYRPVELLTHFADVSVWGSSPGSAWGHHLTNVLLMMTAAVLLFLVFVELLGGIEKPLVAEASFIAVSLYVLHPLQSAAVAYVSGRGDLLVLLFLCVSALSLRRSAALCVAGAVLAILSKENGLLVPLFLLGMDWVLAERGKKIDWKTHLCTFGCAALYLGLRVSCLNFVDVFNFYGGPNVLTLHPSYRLYTYFSTLAKSVQLIFWPVDIHHAQSWPAYPELGIPMVEAGVAVAVLALGGAFGLMRKSRVAALGLAWFIAATLPTSNLVFLINAVFYDHWVIFPMLGVAIALGAAGLACAEFVSLRYPKMKTTGMPNAVWACWVIALVPAVMLTERQNQAWHDPISLYSYILSYEPSSALIMNNLAMAYADEGENGRAEELYRRSIATGDHFAQTHNNLGNLLLTEQKDSLAMDEFRRALEMDPRLFQAHNGLGIALLRLGKREEAVKEFRASLAILPNSQAERGLAEAQAAK